MVSVASVGVRRYTRPLRGALVASGPVHEISGAWVELGFVGGVVGWGEASAWPGLSAPVDVLAQQLEDVARDLCGVVVEDAADLPGLLDPMNLFAPARFALETALLDGLARERAVPLRRLAVGAHDRVVERVAVNSLASSPEGAARDVAAGFSCIKVKVGGDAREDAALVVAIRSAVGSGIELRLDANSRYAPAAAEEFLHATCDAGIAYVEDPTSDLDAWESLARIGTPLALDARLGEPTVRDGLGAAAAVWIIKPMFAGGWLAAEELARQAGHRDKSVVLTSALESRVGVMATAQLAGRLGLEIACGLNIWGEPAARGVLELPSEPGLGASPP